MVTASSVTRQKNCVTLSFDLGGLASDQEYENAIKIDDTISDFDIFGFNHLIGENVSNVSNFDYDDGNLGEFSDKVESELSLVYGSRWSDWIEGSDCRSTIHQFWW